MLTFNKNSEKRKIWLLTGNVAQWQTTVKHMQGCELDPQTGRIDSTLSLDLIFLKWYGEYNTNEQKVDPCLLWGELPSLDNIHSGTKSNFNFMKEQRTCLSQMHRKIHFWCTNSKGFINLNKTNTTVMWESPLVCCD